MSKADNKAVVIDIHLSRGVIIALTGVLLAMAVLTYALWRQEPAAAQSPPQIQAEASSTTGRRQFYRTYTSYLPTAIDSACESGYHFASLWEILDPTHLEYNGYLGWNNPDSGGGPPSYRYGWIRTGYNSSGAEGVAGQDNCMNWTSVNASDYGTVVSLSWQWGSKEDVGAWNASLFPCDAAYPVWCVED